MLLTPVPLGGTQLPDEVVAQFRAIDGDSAAQRAARSELSPRLTDTQLDRLTAVGTPVAAGVAGSNGRCSERVITIGAAASASM